MREDAARWHEARLLREYIAAFEEEVVSGRTNVAVGDLETWLHWARACVARVDPLSRRKGGAPRPDGKDSYPVLDDLGAPVS